jgi:hypothetical protein
MIYFKYPDFKNNWQDAFSSKKFKTQFVITIGVLLSLLTLLSYFFAFIESRAGDQLHDVVLSHLPTYNLSMMTFIVIYSAAIICLINLLPRPVQLLTALLAYFFILLLRIITIYFWPLEAPQDIIPLQDPFVETFFYGHTRITKDLFFSGHVATVCLLFLVNPYRPLKMFYALVVFLVAAFILLQHAHYTIDVLMAPLFAWGAYQLSKWCLVSV